MTIPNQLYIDGQYEEAARRFDAITRGAESEDDVLTAYLYLGRCYMELGDYSAAADALTSGRVLGGGIEFEGYLAEVQEHLRLTSKGLEGQGTLSRAQLAALIDQGFGDRLAGTGTHRVPPDLATHWARETVRRVNEAGVMPSLPDGDFYPDVPVTRAAFYVTLLRLSRVVGIPKTEVSAHFPGGLRVPAGEAAGILQELEQANR